MSTALAVVAPGTVPDFTTALALVRSYGTIRRPLPHQVPALRIVADKGYTHVLPRWQVYGEGFHRPADPGAYTGTRAWLSRRHWTDVVVPAAIAARPELLRGVQGRTPWSVRPRTFLAYCRWLADYAHAGTGRGCIVRNDTLAALLGVSERTVQRCRQAAEALGLYRLVVAGRRLSLVERFHAYWTGSRQRGLANEAALVVPEWLDQERAWTPAPVENGAGAGAPGAFCHPSPVGGRPAPENLTVGSSLGSDRSFAGKKEPAPRAPLDGEEASTRAEGGLPPGKAPQRRRARTYDPLALQLAIALTEGLSWLQGVSPGRIETGLRRFVRCGLPWTAQDIADALDARNARLGLDSVSAGRVHNGPALLAALLRDLDADADHPRLHAATPAERSQWASRRRAANAAAAAAARRAAGPRTPEVRDAAVAAIRDELAALRAERAAELDAEQLAARDRRRATARARAAARRARDN